MPRRTVIASLVNCFILLSAYILLDGVISDPESAFCRHATQLFKHTIPVNLGAVTV